LRPIFIGATTLLALLLGVFAYALADSQDQQRTDLERRFDDRATVAAAVNRSIFSLSTNQTRQMDSAQFGGETVDPTALRRRLAQSQQPYALILTQEGEVLASAGKAPDSVDPKLIERALKSKTTEYSSIIDGPGAAPVIEGATAFPTEFGMRVDVSAVSAALLGQFLNSFLARLPTVADAQSFVVDEMGKLIAAPGRKAKPGAPLADADLAEAIKSGKKGHYDGGRYFTTATMEPTPWRIVLTASDDNLYDSVESTVPWLIFAAFVLVAALGLFLLRRVLRANAELERADISRQHALEINDNVVQRLVLAKYALDRGATETSQQKLAETLRETQQLVTSMLEEKEIGPGSLRREAPAGTEGPPAPPTPDWQQRR
jgi:hypothetical protein